jgi:hypothetical protein
MHNQLQYWFATTMLMSINLEGKIVGQSGRCTMTNQQTSDTFVENKLLKSKLLRGLKHCPHSPLSAIWFEGWMLTLDIGKERKCSAGCRIAGRSDIKSSRRIKRIKIE